MATIDVNTTPKGVKPSLINLKVLSAIALFASKDETRYYLNGVVVELTVHGAIYIATDGMRLVVYRDELIDKQKNHLHGRFIIPTPQCKVFKLGEDDDGYGKIFQEHGRLTIAHGFVDIRFAPIEGPAINWRRIIPPRASGNIAQFDLPMLADFQKFAKALDLPQPFVASNGEAPAPVWFPGKPEIVGLIVPRRAQDELQRDVPVWARGNSPFEDQGDIEDALQPEDEEGEGGNVTKMKKPA